jgi:hypothetical protein
MATQHIAIFDAIEGDTSGKIWTFAQRVLAHVGSLLFIWER